MPSRVWPPDDPVRYPDIASHFPTNERTPLRSSGPPPSYTSAPPTRPPSYRSRPPSPPPQYVPPRYSGYGYVPPSPRSPTPPRYTRKQQERCDLIASLVVYLFLFLLAALAGFACLSAQWPASVPTPPATIRVAVVGGGLSGVSAAYHLAALSTPKTHYNITIFEKAPQLGGRCKSVQLAVPGMATQPLTIELGAPGIHKTQDQYLFSVADKLALDTPAGHRWLPMAGISDWDLGVHNGHAMLYRRPASSTPGSFRWWTSLGYFLRYGWAHRNLWRLMSGVTRGLVVSDSWASVSNAAAWAARTRAADYFRAVSRMGGKKSEPIGEPFTTEHVQGHLRARYGANLGSASGWAALDVMMRAETEAEDEVVVTGGWEALLRTMVNNSPRVDVRLNREVLGWMKRYNTTVYENGTTTETFAGWIVAHKDSSATPKNPDDMDQETFDLVLFAAPHETLTNFNPQPAPAWPSHSRSWEEMHTTILATPRRLRPSRFALGAGDFRGMPGRILTTLTNDEQRGEGQSTGFDGLGHINKWWSIETLAHFPVQTRPNPLAAAAAAGDITLAATLETHYVYKLLSPRELDNATLADILDGQELDSASFLRRQRWDNAFVTPVPRDTAGLKDPPRPVDEQGLWYVGEREGMPGWEGVEGAVVAGRRVAEEIAAPEGASRMGALRRFVRRSHLW